MTSQATVESSVPRSERVHCARGLNSLNLVHAPGLSSHDEADLVEYRTKDGDSSFYRLEWKR